MAQESPSDQHAAGSYIAQAGQGSSASVNVYSTPPPPTDLNRRRLLSKVRAFWITGMLEQSLHGAALIELGLQEQSDAIMNPWRMVVQEADHPVSPLLSGTHIAQVYDQSEGELLILGAPGAGKTTLLLQLACDLLTRAQQDESHPIPVVFNLSSWATNRQSLTAWLVDELNSKYQVSQKLGQEWVAEDKILPLLDGLDEVKRECRVACVEAINKYRSEHGLASMVVCCRNTDYDSLGPSTRLLLHSAIVVQPLTAEQIDDYLASGGEKLSAVREVLQTDPDLQEMAATPLMLSVLTLAYAGRRPDDLLVASSPQLRRQQVFATYVERMLCRRGAENQYTPEQVKHWLSWLAKQMTQHGQSEFYLERMQPDWLSSVNEWFPFFFGALVRVSIGVFFGIIICLAFWLGNTFTALPSPSSFSRSDDVLVNGLIFGLVGGLAYGLVSPLKTNIKPAEIIVWSWKSIWQRLRKSKALRSWLFFALIFGVLGMLVGMLVGVGIISSSGGSKGDTSIWIYSVLSGLLSGLLFALLEWLIFRRLYGSIEDLARDMQKEQTRVTRKHRIWEFVRNRVLVGLIFGLVSGLISSFLFIFLVGMVVVINGKLYKDPGWWWSFLLSIFIIGAFTGILSWLIFAITSRVDIRFKPVKIFVWLVGSICRHLGKSEELTRGLAIVLIFGLFGELTAILDYGTSEGLLDKIFWFLSYGLLGGFIFRLFIELAGGLSSKTMEEQTLVRPNQGIRRSLRNSVIVGLIFGLLAGLVFGLLGEDYLRDGLIYGLLIALLIGLPNGGVACIQHSILRLLLWHTGSIPRHYTRFLNYAAARILLRQIGGGYVFIHGFLLEYFATLNSAPPNLAKTVERSKWKERVFKINPFLLARVGLVIGIAVVLISLRFQLQHPYLPANAKLVLNDSLSVNNGIWPEATNSSGTCRFTNNAYQVISNGSQLEHCPAGKINFRNFTIEAEMTIVKGDDAVLVFRDNRKSGYYYTFQIDKDGKYCLESYKNHHFNGLVGRGQNFIAINSDGHQPNRIALVVQENTFDLRINDQYTTTMSDPNNTSDQGSIDFGSQSHNKNSTVTLFRHVKIWRNE